MYELHQFFDIFYKTQQTAYSNTLADTLSTQDLLT